MSQNFSIIGKSATIFNLSSEVLLFDSKGTGRLYCMHVDTFGNSFYCLQCRVSACPIIE